MEINGNHSTCLEDRLKIDLRLFGLESFIMTSVMDNSFECLDILRGVFGADL